MLHETILAELLDSEIDSAARLGCPISRDGHVVVAHLSSSAEIRLDARRYDAEPMSVTVTAAGGGDLPPTRWPGSLYHSVHPVHERPFVCIRGTFEYHSHPSHLAERWDLYRGKLQLVDLLEHLLAKAGWAP